MTAGDAVRWRPLWCHGPRWFRVLGYGVRYLDHRQHPPLFSERYGYRRYFLHIGPHCFGLLTPPLVAAVPVHQQED